MIPHYTIFSLQRFAFMFFLFIIALLLCYPTNIQQVKDTCKVFPTQDIPYIHEAKPFTVERFLLRLSHGYSVFTDAMFQNSVQHQEYAEVSESKAMFMTISI